MQESVRPSTLGELKASGYTSARRCARRCGATCSRTLAQRRALLPGIIGYDETVIPEIENAHPRRAPHGVPRRARPGEDRASSAALAGAARSESCRSSRAARSTTTRSRRSAGAAAARVAERGRRARRSRGSARDAALRREARHAGRLDGRPDRRDRSRSRSPRAATSPTRRPSTTASSRARNRGIFAINELPDLTEKVQVGLFNLMEEKDVQIKGYKIRLPLDVVIVASANPEDYTSRGRIITPLKDRFDVQIRTHYPRTLEDEIAIMEQEVPPLDRGGRAAARAAVHEGDRRADHLRGARLERDQPGVGRERAGHASTTTRALISQRREARGAPRRARDRAAAHRPARRAGVDRRQDRARVRRRGEEGRATSSSA